MLDEMHEPLPATMHAWRKHKGNPQPVWEEVPVPKVPITGFLCRMLASGVCHSDWSLLTNENQRPWFQDQYVLGHEGSAEIIQIGDKVADSRFQIGDKIALLAVPGCGEKSCQECSVGIPQLCQVGNHSGIGQDGFFAPYATIDVRGAVKIPAGKFLRVSPGVAAAATDAVTTAYHAVTRRAEVQKHETVFLFGLGGLGFNALQTILTIGARVIVSDVKQERLDAAIALGVPKADVVPVGTNIPEFVKEKGLSTKIDTTLDFVGKHQTFHDAQRIVRIAGKMVCIGTLDLENTIDMKIGVRKRLSINFSYGGTTKDLEEVLDLIAQKKINPHVETSNLESFATVLEDLHAGKIAGRMALLHT